jgi:hypothetical protein
MAVGQDQSGWMLERTGGNFELIAACSPPGRGLAHYWHDRNLAFTSLGSWTEGDRIRKPDFCGPCSGASLILASSGDLEMVATQDDGSLAHFRRAGIHGWQGPIFLPGRAAGPPAFIRGRFGQHGNYEVIVPTPGGGLSHFWRDNDGGEVWHEAARPANAGQWSGLGVIHSSFGNLEVVGTKDRELVFLSQNGAGGTWSAPPDVIPIGSPVVGRPGFIQSSYGNPGNFEVVVANNDGRLSHLWRDNNAAGFPWAVARVFGTDRRGRVRSYDDVTLLQSSFGRLEVMAHVSGRSVLEHFRAPLGEPWEGPIRALRLPCEE